MDMITEFADLSEIFEFDANSLDYVDASLSGWLRHRMTGELFVFDCQPIIYNMLWPWTLVAATQKIDIVDALEEACRVDTGHWLSIVEDRRGSVPKCRAVRVENAVARPV